MKSLATYAILALAIVTMLHYGATRPQPIAARLDMGNQLAAISGAGSGLVGLWALDDGSGSLAADAASANTGALISGPAWVTGVVGTSALHFNGSTNYVVIEDKDYYTPSTGLSVSTWVKANSTDSAGEGLVTKMRALSGFQGWSLYRTSAEKFAFQIADAVNNSTVQHTLTSTAAYADTAWHHLVATYDGSQIRLYVDGAEAANPLSYTGSLVDTTNKVCIGTAGTYNSVCGMNFFSGTMDDVRIYSRALTLTEVGELYTLGGGMATTQTPPPQNQNQNQNTQNSQQSYDVRTSAPAPVQWSAPLGLPTPPFGITETNFMYQLQTGETCATSPNKCFDFGSGLQPYHDDGYGPYTHYVDPTASGCVTTGFGTPSAPRCTIPLPLPPGSVVELSGRWTQTSGGYFSLEGSHGTAQRPIFVRGKSASQKPFITVQWNVINSSYLILENLEFGDQDGNLSGGATGELDVTDKNSQRYDSDHIAVRSNDLHGNMTDGALGVAGFGGSSFTDIVFYKNYIHDNGDVHANYDQDVHGIVVGVGTQRVWVVDNEMARNSGDGIQINGTTNAQNVRQVYVGRNVSHNNKQMGFWTKDATDVIFTQNVAYGHVPSASSGGAGGLGYQYDPQHVWIIFNESYGNNSGLVTGSSEGRGRADINIFGNVFHDNALSGINMRGGYVDTTIGFNTIYNNPIGIWNEYYRSPVTIVGNVISVTTGNHIDLNDSTSGAASSMRYNLFNGTAKIRWTAGAVQGLSAFKSSVGCDGCIEGNAMLASDGQLGGGSPAIDAAGTALANAITSRFQSAYGIDISRDFFRNGRPVNSAWDMGAYEYGGTYSSNPVYQPPASNGNTSSNSSSNSNSNTSSNSNAQTSNTSSNSSSNSNSANSSNNNSAANNTVANVPGCSNLPPSVFRYDMMQGTSSPNVRALQIFLNTRGYPVAQVGAGSRGNETNFFGPATMRALTTYQAANGLTRTGTLDANTRTLIDNLNLMPQCRANVPTYIQASTSTIPFRAIATTTSALYTRTLTIGIEGTDVTQLQTYLASLPGIYPEKKVTGYFGSLTQKAVGKFQEFYSIAGPGDPGYGQVGPKTRAKLNELRNK